MRSGLVARSVAAVMAVASLQVSAHQALLTQARQALGGDRTLSAITSFRVKGSVTLPGARGTASGSFEIACALPDRFVQTEDRGEFWSGETVSSTPIEGSQRNYQHTKLGFVGKELVYQPQPVHDYPGMGEHFPPVTPGARLKGLAEARVGFSNLTLAMFATSFAGFPLTFADAPASNAVLVTGDGFSATLRFDQVTHLPAELAAEGRRPMTYADYRDVQGVKLPFRISDGVRTWMVKTFEINPRIDPKVFRPVVPSR